MFSNLLNGVTLFQVLPQTHGKNMLGSLMKKAAEEVGLDGRITNQSIRKTTVTTLSKAGVPQTKIMQVTGHRSIASITTYDSKISFEEQRQYSNILTGS